MLQKKIGASSVFTFGDFLKEEKNVHMEHL